MKSLYSMSVILASAGPETQSCAPTGGKIESSVGPGVGRGLMTVQWAEPETEVLGGVWVGATSEGIGEEVTLGIAVGGGLVWLWQAARRRPRIKKMECLILCMEGKCFIR